MSGAQDNRREVSGTGFRVYRSPEGVPVVEYGRWAVPEMGAALLDLQARAERAEAAATVAEADSNARLQALRVAAQDAAEAVARAERAEAVAKAERRSRIADMRFALLMHPEDGERDVEACAEAMVESKAADAALRAIGVSP